MGGVKGGREGERTLQPKGSVTRGSKIGQSKVQFDWKLGKQQEGKQERNFALLGRALKAGKDTVINLEGNIVIKWEVFKQWTLFH